MTNQDANEMKSKLTEMFDSMGRDFKVFFKDELFEFIDSFVKDNDERQT